MDVSSVLTFLPQILQGCIVASDAILSVYQSDFQKTLKADGSPVTEADLQSNEIITQVLAQTNIPIIAEENSKESYDVRASWETVWLVDPFDGTKEFVKKNDEFVICIALIHQQKPVLGIIASPIQKEILVGGSLLKPSIVRFDAVHSPQKWIPISPKETLDEVVVISGSRSHQSGSELKFTNQLKSMFEKVHFQRKGSALKFFDLALGHADVYPRFAPTMEWDIAAGHAIIEALGGEVLHAEKETPLYYNKENLYNPYFVVQTKAYKKYITS